MTAASIPDRATEPPGGPISSLGTRTISALASPVRVGAPSPLSLGQVRQPGSRRSRASRKKTLLVAPVSRMRLSSVAAPPRRAETLDRRSIFPSPASRNGTATDRGERAGRSPGASAAGVASGGRSASGAGRVVEDHHPVAQERLPEEPQDRPAGDAADDARVHGEHGRDLVHLEGAQLEAGQGPRGDVHGGRAGSAVGEAEDPGQLEIHREVPGARVQEHDAARVASAGDRAWRRRGWRPRRPRSAGPAFPRATADSARPDVDPPWPGDEPAGLDYCTTHYNTARLLHFANRRIDPLPRGRTGRARPNQPWLRGWSVRISTPSVPVSSIVHRPVK